MRVRTATSRAGSLLHWGLPLAGVLLLEAWIRALWGGYLAGALLAFLLTVYVAYRRRGRLPQLSARAYLVGAVLFGNTGDGPWYLDLIRSGTSIADIRHDLAFGRALAERGLALAA